MTDANEIEKLICKDIKGAIVEIATDDNVHYDIHVISDCFVDMGLVERQQLIYGIIAPLIANGDIHAVSLITHTMSEAQSK